jgi:predicted DNA-binding protein (UPF0251 family)
LKHSARLRGALLALPLLLGSVPGAAAATVAVHGGPQTFVSDVARHLGVPEQKLKDAITKARLDRVQGLLREGRITSSQAAEMEQAIRAGRPPMVLHHRGRVWGRAMVQDAAGYLGLSATAFSQKLRSGQSPAAIAQAQGKTAAGLEQALLQSARQRLAAEVAAGRLSTAQAAAVGKRLPAHIHRFVSGGWQHAAPLRPSPAPAGKP